MLIWDEKYSTGVAQLDKQHKSLFQYTNDLGEHIKNNFGSQETTNNMVQFLERYIKAHFNQEEACMHKYLCPIATKNKDAHQKFILTFKAAQEKIKNEKTSNKALKELHCFLEKWIREHLCKIDVQLKPCVH